MNTGFATEVRTSENSASKGEHFFDGQVRAESKDGIESHSVKTEEVLNNQEEQFRGFLFGGNVAITEACGENAHELMLRSLARLLGTAAFVDAIEALGDHEERSDELGGKHLRDGEAE